MMSAAARLIYASLNVLHNLFLGGGFAEFCFHYRYLIGGVGMLIGILGEFPDTGMRGGEAAGFKSDAGVIGFPKLADRP